jgi:hypothetical protein
MGTVSAAPRRAHGWRTGGGRRHRGRVVGVGIGVLFLVVFVGVVAVRGTPLALALTLALRRRRGRRAGEQRLRREAPLLRAGAAHERRHDAVHDLRADPLLVQEPHLRLGRVHVHVHVRGREREREVHERRGGFRQHARVRALERALERRGGHEAVCARMGQGQLAVRRGERRADG